MDTSRKCKALGSGYIDIVLQIWNKCRLLECLIEGLTDQVGFQWWFERGVRFAPDSETLMPRRRIETGQTTACQVDSVEPGQTTACQVDSGTSANGYTADSVSAVDKPLSKILFLVIRVFAPLTSSRVGRLYSVHNPAALGISAKYKGEISALPLKRLVTGLSCVT